MKKITLVTNGTRHEFTGQVVGSTHDERNVTKDGCTNREVSHHLLYQKDDQSFVLYTDRRYVGCGSYKRTLQPLETLHSIYELLPEQSADHLISQVLDSYATNHAD